MLPVIISAVTALSLATPKEIPNIDQNKYFAKEFMASTYAWNEEQFVCLDKLWQAESGWNHRAHNRSSGAYGIPQSLPGHKMKSAGSDWKTNPQTQIRWGLSYIKQRYSEPCGAWNHFQRKRWY